MSELFKVYHSYTGLVRDAIDRGYEKAGTRSLGPTIFAIESGYTNRDLLIYPTSRMGLKTYVTYMLAEAAWYMARSREVDFISQYGPIWQSMIDDKGLVNSNYGYQIYNNNDLGKELPYGVPIRYDIVTESNSHSKTDLVCNNFVYVTRYRDEVHDCDYVDIRSMARSIDLIYGLPFDMVALQGFAYFLLKEKGIEGYIGKIEFTMIDAHIYESILPQLDLSYTEDTYSGIDYTHTPYNRLTFTKRDYKGVNYRELAKTTTIYSATTSPTTPFQMYYSTYPYDQSKYSYPDNDLTVHPHSRKDILYLKELHTIYYNTNLQGQLITIKVRV